MEEMQRAGYQMVGGGHIASMPSQGTLKLPTPHCPGIFMEVSLVGMSIKSLAFGD